MSATDEEPEAAEPGTADNTDTSTSADAASW